MDHSESPPQNYITDCTEDGVEMRVKFSELLNLPSEHEPKSAEIFSAVSAGDEALLGQMSTQMESYRSDQNDTVLHLAASSGHLELVKSILSKWPCLLQVKNSNDQLPIHVASRAGRLAVVKALVESLQSISADQPEEDTERLNPYVLKDKNGDTALHLALKEYHLGTSVCLVKAYQQASFLANNDGKSPLYMAVEAGYVSLVQEMLTPSDINGVRGTKFDLDSQLEGKKSLVHVALKAKNKDMLQVLLNQESSLEKERDEKGKTCLSVAASIGYNEGVEKLLSRSEESAFVCDAKDESKESAKDDDGSFPIHKAAENGHLGIVKELLKKSPYSKQLLNKKRQNVLHVAAKHGKDKIVRHLMKSDKTKHLMEDKDEDGNTPLHLATKHWHPRSIFGLSLGGNRLLARNNEGLTALDIAKSARIEYVFVERLTLALLLHAHASKGCKTVKSLTQTSNDSRKEAYVETLLVVATLITTATFAAGFTVPGGFNSSAPNMGRAILATDPYLFAFLVLDTLAMQTSFAATAILIWAQLGNDSTAIGRSLNTALLLMFTSLLFMSLTFYFAVVLMVGHVTGLLVVISVTFLVFLYSVFFILGPHVLLQMPFLHRYWGYYLMFFMWYDSLGLGMTHVLNFFHL